MGNEVNMNEELDVVGQEMIFSEKNRGGNGVWTNVDGKEMPLGPDVYYPAVLESIIPNVHAKWGNGFVFQFRMEGTDYSWKNKEGEIKQFTVRKTTSRVLSPRSALYKLYSKLARELKEGEIVGKNAPGLKSLIGTPVNLMLEAKTYPDSEGNTRTSYKVDKVVRREVAVSDVVSSVLPQKEAVKKQPLAEPVKSAEVAKPTTPVTKPAVSVPSAPVSDSDIFDVDDILKDIQ